MARYDRGDAGNFPGGRHFPPERATGRCRSSWDHGRACRDASTHRHPCPPSQGCRAACRSSDRARSCRYGGTGPRVGLAVQRRHFSERGGGNPHSEDESPGDDQRCMLQHGSCSFRARCPVEAKLPVECFMRMCRMQRNVTKCIGVAGKAAPCGGAGPSRVQGLRGTPDAACNQEKEKSSGRCFANHRLLAFWGFRFRHPILPMRFSR